jgi:hypothetical protein
LVLRHHTRIVRGSEPGRDIARGHGRVRRIAPSCALDRLRETSRSERGNIAITPSPSLAGIITELGTSRLL